jgi:CRP/FNR family cyclic AMP-dependent transcriptional regulator
MTARGAHVALREALAASPVLQGCTSADIRDLVRRGRETTLPAGWTFVRQDTPADACYLIVEGVATVSRRGEVVATLSAGDIVGEVALARARLRNATVTAQSRLRLLHIDAASFDALSPRLRAALLRDVQQRTPTPAESPAAPLST